MPSDRYNNDSKYAKNVDRAATVITVVILVLLDIATVWAVDYIVKPRIPSGIVWFIAVTIAVFRHTNREDLE